MPTSRRVFLLRLLALPLARWLPAWLSPVVVAPPALDVHVAGFRFHAGPYLIRRMRPGAEVRLTAEPDNPHDPFAVRVDFEGSKIGYLPRDRNRPAARLLWAGGRVDARILEVDPAAEPWRAVRIRVRTPRRDPGGRAPRVV